MPIAKYDEEVALGRGRKLPLVRRAAQGKARRVRRTKCEFLAVRQTTTSAFVHRRIEHVDQVLGRDSS